MATLRNYRSALALFLGQRPGNPASWAGASRAAKGQVCNLMGGTGPVLLAATWLAGGSRPAARLGETRLQCSVYPNSDHHDMKKLMTHQFVNQGIENNKQSLASKTCPNFTNPMPSGFRAQGQEGPQEPAPAPGAKVSDNRPEPGQAT
jgi:hypothetical protein